MARLSRFPARSQIRRPKRSVVWGFGPDADALAVTAVGKTLWSTGIVLAAELEATIVRTRGWLNVTGTLFTSANDSMRGACGLAVVTNEAFAAGVASIPGPFNEPDWQGWFWHTYWHIVGTAAQSTGADIAINAQRGMQRIEIDSKAMRKWSAGDTVVGVLEVGNEIGTVGASVSADTRMLIKLT